MRTPHRIVILLLLLSPCFAGSQPVFPPNAPVFDSAVVARIDIAIDPDTLQWIYENVESEIKWRADFGFVNGTIDDTLGEIGFSLGGNTSRYSQKKSFNLDFNHFRPGREFRDLDKLNLNGEHNDPSVTRSRICWEWLRAFNLPAPRAAHAQVYINGNYFGLYMMVEQIDDEFVDSRFGDDDGNLYKCLWPADLAYLGDDPELYKFTSGDRRAYDLRTNEGADDYSDLAHFIDVLNNTPDEELECELEKVFNLNDYLKIAALDIMTGNWDGYIYNKNNFYLYHNTATGKFEYIPYDLDNTLGIDWLDRDWATRDIYEWEQHGSEVRPLYARLMDIPELRDRYSFYFGQLLDLLADEDSLFSEINRIRDLIAPSVAADPFYPLDYGFTYSHFLGSFESAWGGHVDYGIKPFIQLRKSNAAQQLVLNEIHPVVRYVKASQAVPGKVYWVRAMVEDDSPLPTVRLVYRQDGGAEQSMDMADNGNQHDYEKGDGFFGCTLPALQLNTTLVWQVEVSDISGNTVRFPCEPVVLDLSASQDPQLFINELMADNDSTIADEYGEYDNWVEVFNGDDVAVWLGDKYLSDNLDNPDKWKLPDLTMQPGAFIVIWADGQPEQGPFHASYKLNDEGEELGIFDSETTGYFLIDSVSWGWQSIDISYGRHADGEQGWVFFTDPTPGYSNGTFLVEEPVAERMGTVFYPNPVIGGVLHFNRSFSGYLIDLTGRKVWEGSLVHHAELRNLQPGIYFLLDEGGCRGRVLIP